MSHADRPVPRRGTRPATACSRARQIVEYAGTPYGTFREAPKKYPLRQAVLLSPVVPSKIVAVALNYREHAEELNRPCPPSRSSS